MKVGDKITFDFSKLDDNSKTYFTEGKEYEIINFDSDDWVGVIDDENQENNVYKNCILTIKEETKKPNHYNNDKGSIYKFAEEQGLNTYEFDLIKRIVRCRKKGQFKEDLEKTKFLIDLYIKENETK